MPKPFSWQSKVIIASLISYFEKENGGPLLPINCIRERVSDALQINIQTIYEVSGIMRKGEVPSSPKKLRPRSKPLVYVDSFTEAAIRNVIYEMYKDKVHITCSLQQVTSTIWNNTVEHTNKVIEEWWNREVLFDNEDVPLIINLNADSSSEESE